MILPLLSLVVHTRAAQTRVPQTRVVAPPPAEVARVKAFVALARADLYPDPAPQAAVSKKIEPIPEPRFNPSTTDAEGLTRSGYRAYFYDQADIALNPATGRVGSYRDGGDPALPLYTRGDDGVGVMEPRKVSDGEAVALARRFYAAAGWPGEIAVRFVQDHEGTNDMEVEVYYYPAAGGVPYVGFDSVIWVNRRTGRLDSFEAEEMPTPPPSLVPRGSLAAARLLALRYGTEFRGEVMAERPGSPFALRIWYPEAGGEYDYSVPIERRGYGPRALAALRGHRGILAYVGWLMGGSRDLGLGVVVDATTGEILDRVPPIPSGAFGGGGGGNPKADPASLAVPLAARPWRVATGGRGWDAWSKPAPAALAPVTAPLPTGTRLTLTDGSLAFPAAYDPKLNLLAVSGKAYRPGPALATLLRRRTAK